MMKRSVIKISHPLTCFCVAVLLALATLLSFHNEMKDIQEKVAQDISRGFSTSP